MHIQELARRLGAAADSALDFDVDGLATMESAGPKHVTFFSNPSYAQKLKDTRAGAVLVARDFQGESGAPLLRVGNPYLAFARALGLFHRPASVARGVHPTAVLGTGVLLGRDVSIGAYCVLGDDVAVGDGTTLHPHVVVYRGARLGSGCVLHSHSVVREDVRLGDRVILQNGAVIGGDGFGFAPRGDGTWEKIPQTGTAVLGDDVEVQALACVDRATVGLTSVGSGTKIDNLVQIGHGCEIGSDTIICGQVGLAGTTRVGSRVTIAGQVGVAGHLTIGDGATVSAQSGVIVDVPPNTHVAGSPATPARIQKASLILFTRLPEIMKRLKSIESRLPADSKAPSAHP